MGWIEANGYRLTGPDREIYLQGGTDPDDPSYVTEIQQPVEKNSDR
jgi:effector-binding domain-containing protein